MNIRPLGDRVLVEPKKENETTVSGIVLPDSHDGEKKAEGKIIALGKGEKLAKLDLQNGDRVIFAKWGGDDFKDGDKEYKILNHDQILAVIE